MPVPRLRFFAAIDFETGDGFPQRLPMRLAEVLGFVLWHATRPTPTQQIARAIWPDRPQRMADRDLEAALWRLLNHPGLAPLVVHDGAAATLSAAGVVRPHVDVLAVRSRLLPLIDRSEPSMPVIARATRAVRLVRGAAFASLTSDWAELARLELREMVLAALDRLAALAEARGDLAANTSHLVRLVRMEPLREDVHRRLMLAYMRQGARGRAAAQYRACETALAQALGIDPMPETRRLYRALIAAPRRARNPVAPHLRVAR